MHIALSASVLLYKSPDMNCLRQCCDKEHRTLSSTMVSTQGTVVSFLAKRLVPSMKAFSHVRAVLVYPAGGTLRAINHGPKIHLLARWFMGTSVATQPKTHSIISSNQSQSYRIIVPQLSGNRFPIRSSSTDDRRTLAMDRRERPDYRINLLSFTEPDWSSRGRGEKK